MPFFTCAIQAFLLGTLIASCERREQRPATSGDVGETRAALGGSAAIVVPSTASRPISPRVAVVRAEPNAAASGADTDSLATPQELADLSARLDVPVQGIVRSELRDTYAETRGANVHEALDIPAARGTPVLSAADGRLLKLFDSNAGGLMVYATDASERFILLYGHLDRYADGLRDGMRLERGQTIGYVGTTGNASLGTPHLHFGILRGHPQVAWWKGVPLNPYPLLVPARPAR